MGDPLLDGGAHEAVGHRSHRRGVLQPRAAAVGAVRGGRPHRLRQHPRGPGRAAPGLRGPGWTGRTAQRHAHRHEPRADVPAGTQWPTGGSIVLDGEGRRGAQVRAAPRGHPRPTCRRAATTAAGATASARASTGAPRRRRSTTTTSRRVASCTGPPHVPVRRPRLGPTEFPIAMVGPDGAAGDGARRAQHPRRIPSLRVGLSHGPRRPAAPRRRVRSLRLERDPTSRSTAWRCTCRRRADCPAAGAAAPTAAGATAAAMHLRSPRRVVPVRLPASAHTAAPIAPAAGAAPAVSSPPAAPARQRAAPERGSRARRSPPPARASVCRDRRAHGGEPVLAPSVGLFWRSPVAGAPPFVEVGARSRPGTRSPSSR